MKIMVYKYYLTIRGTLIYYKKINYVVCLVSNNNTQLTTDSYVYQNGDRIELRDKPLYLGNLVELDVRYPGRPNAAATKAYVDGLVRGVVATFCVQAATTQNLNVAKDVENGDSLDGIILNSNHLLLIKDQSDLKENGLYVVSPFKAPVRVPADKLANGSIVFIEHGVLNEGQFYRVRGQFTGIDNIPVYGVDEIIVEFIDINLINNSSNTINFKDSVRAASALNVNIVVPGAIIGGVTLNLGDRILLKNQNVGSQNGIWIWQGLNNPLFRAPDANSSDDVTSGLFLVVNEGDLAGTGWILTTPNPIALGATALTFDQFGSGGSSVTTLGQLTDVQLSNSQPNDILAFNGTKWVNTPQQTLGGTTTTYDDQLMEILSIPLNPNTNVLLDIRVNAFRSGGTAGSDGDNAAFIKQIKASRINSANANLDIVQSSFTSRAQTWDIEAAVVNTTLKIYVKGSIDNNVEWKFQYISQILSA